MSRQITKAKGPDTKATLRALRRAARRARELGAKTGTPVYVIYDNHIVDLTKQDSMLAKQTLKQRETR